ncbi:hypothetical protein GCM10011507_07910 [Edaphobacter acidisoli]|uniref:TMEM205-like domain-containing protein n=1 Tax=Edaphobacter acidisoli TaxID=2040573 RepID=A0A916RK05_9BACT|nr:DUF4149 domain-containing protein [Edaphobacter acidisoli]GGA58957.1 hypothetical protein GCM10011507_07910 [Edaphobacter acidisoli]
MQTFLRAVRLLIMVLWVGGLCFFAFVVAPVAFSRLPSAHEAGLVVGGTLRILHWIGLIGGLVFCLANVWLWFRAEVPARLGFAIQFVLVGMMLIVTAYSQFSILPQMDRDQQIAGGIIEAAPLDNAGRIDFERLHPWSERLEGFVLLCGIGVVLVLSRESQWPETGKIKTI